MSSAVMAIKFERFYFSKSQHAPTHGPARPKRARVLTRPPLCSARPYTRPCSPLTSRHSGCCSKTPRSTRNCRTPTATRRSGWRCRPNRAATRSPCSSSPVAAPSTPSIASQVRPHAVSHAVSRRVNRESGGPSVTLSHCVKS